MSEEWGQITVYDPVMASECADMFNAFNELWLGGFGGGIPYTEQRVKEWLDKTSAIADLIAIDEEGVPVGYCGLYHHWRDEKAAYISIIGVIPRVQGKKFGKRLLLKALEVAKNNGISRVDLHTWSGNMEAMPLYKKVGLYWVPETSVYMQDFIPGLLQTPLAVEWFEKHQDWYGCFKRELTQAPDEYIVDNMELYTYVFEVDDDKLTAEVDRYGWGFTSITRVLDGKAISIKTRLESHEILMGISNTMTISINNDLDEDISFALSITPFKGLTWKEEFPQSITVKNGENVEISREFIVDNTATEFKSNQRSSEVIKTSISFGNYNLELLTGGKIKPAVKLTSDFQYEVAPVGTEKIVYLDIFNHSNKKIEGIIDIQINGIKEGSKTVEFNLEPEEITGIDIPITIPVKTQQTVFTILAKPTIKISDSYHRMPEYKIQIVADITNLAEVIEGQDKERITLLTDYWSIEVFLEGGNMTFARRNLEGGQVKSIFQIGPPFGLDLDRTLKFDYKKVKEGNNITLELHAKSRKVEGLKIQKFVKITPGIREFEHWIELTNISDSGTLAAGGRFSTGVPQGLSVNPFGNYASVITPVNNKYIECDPTLPIMSDTLVPIESKDWHETWTAGEYLGEASFAAWFWKPENISKVKVTKGILDNLESESKMLEQNETLEVVHTWFGHSYTSIQDVRNRWNQFVNFKEIPDEERMFGVKTVQPIEIRLKGSNILEKGITVSKIIELVFETPYPFAGELKLELPKGWNGCFKTSEGNGRVIPIPQPTPNIPVPIEIELTPPTNTTKATEILNLRFISEYELNFDIPIVLKGKTDVTIEESEIEGESIYLVKNGALQFCVPKFFGGNLIKLEDNEGNTYFNDNFPKIQPKFFIDHHIGGVQPLVFWMNEDNPFSEPEKTKTEIVEDGEWKGIKSTWIISKSEHLKGQEISLSYLTLPDSNLVRIKLENNNTSSRRIRSVSALLADICMQGDIENSVIHVPGGLKTWTRNRVMKPFLSNANPDEPWVRITKNSKSLDFICPDGFHGSNTIFDAQVAIMNFMVSLFDLKPKEKAVVEFALAINQPYESIGEIRKALAK